MFSDDKMLYLDLGMMVLGKFIHSDIIFISLFYSGIHPHFMFSLSGLTCDVVCVASMGACF